MADEKTLKDCRDAFEAHFERISTPPHKPTRDGNGYIEHRSWLNWLSAWEAALNTRPASTPAIPADVAEAALRAAADVHGGYMNATKKKAVIAAINVVTHSHQPSILPHELKDAIDVMTAVLDKSPHGLGPETEKRLRILITAATSSQSLLHEFDSYKENAFAFKEQCRKDVDNLISERQSLRDENTALRERVKGLAEALQNLVNEHEEVIRSIGKYEDGHKILTGIADELTPAKEALSTYRGKEASDG